MAATPVAVPGSWRDKGSLQNPEPAWGVDIRYGNKALLPCANPIRIAPSPVLPYNRAMSAPERDSPRRSAPREDAFLTAVAATLGLFLFLALCYPLLRGNIYQAGDLGSSHFPARSFYSHCLKEGLRFLWWPDEFCGYYLHGEGQVGMFHPAHWLAYRFFPLDWAFNLEFASGYLMLYGGMVALLRRWHLPWYAALFGANLFTFSGFTLVHFTHLQAITIIGHYPWMLLALDVLLRSPDPTRARRSWLALILLTASALLLGYPQYVLFALMAIGLYTAFHWPPAQALPRIGAVAIALLLGLAIAGVQVLPTVDQLHYAARTGADDFWRSGSLHPVNLLQWAGPYWFKNRLSFGDSPMEYALYTGMVPLLLSISLVAQWKPLNNQRNLMALFAFQAVLMLILALGEYGGLYGVLAKVPLLGAFRCAARHIVLVHFALSVLAALAITQRRHMPPTGSDGNRMAALVLGAWVTLGIALAIRRFAATDIAAAITTPWPWLLAGPILLTVAAGLLCSTRRWPRTGLTLIMIFATLDIAAFALPLVWFDKPQSTSLEALHTVLRRELPDDPALERDTVEFRAHGNWRLARLAPLGLPNYMGYVGLPPAWTLDPDADSTKRLAGVRWEKRPLSAGPWTVRGDALPRARLITQVIESKTPRETIKSIDLTTTALVSRPVDIPPGPSGKVTWIRQDPGDLLLKTDAGSPQLLVLADRFHPGWRVSIDGQPVTLLRVNGDFMGCIVPAGAHETGFFFAPRSFHWGITLTLAGLALTGALILLHLRNCTTRPQAAA